MASLENTYHYLRQYEKFTLIQTCENVELTVSKSCDLLLVFPSRPAFSFSVGHVDPTGENPGKNTKDC